MAESAAAHIVRTRLRAIDRDRYVAALFAPRSVRDDLFALCAADAEIGRIADAVTEPMLGEIRLEWWREALLDGNAPTGDPVADACAAAILTHRLDRARVSDMIDARRFDVTGGRMPDMRALRTWAEKSSGASVALAAALLAPDADRRKVDDASAAAGRALGLTRVVTRFAEDSVRGRFFVPPGIVAADQPDDERSALRDLHDRALAALNRAHEAMSELPRGARPAFSPLALLRPRLDAARRADFDPERAPLEIGPLSRLWRLWRAA
jgi:phytoene synthase